MLYQIKNTENGKCYIGSTKNWNRRKNLHKYALENDKHINNHLQNAWNKYGSESFEFEVIRETENQFEEEQKILSKEALDILISYDWPGNIRELENIMEQVAVMSEGIEITAEDIPLNISGDSAPSSDFVFNPLDNKISFNEAVDNYQKVLILDALRKTDWVKAKAAKLLQMNRTTLVEKIKKLGISNNG